MKPYLPLLASPLLFALAIPLAAAADDAVHPDTSGDGWADLIAPDLSDAKFPEGVWTFEDGVLTASEDQAIWTEATFDDFVLDLEFKTADGTNSGVIVHCSDTENWIPNSVEVQIADDFAEQWKNAPKTWQCAAIFGRLAPAKSNVKAAGEWNRMTITCRGKMITVALNGEAVTEMDMAKWTDPSKNPDGSEIPAWLNKPAAGLPLTGFIGLQGKHAGAPIYFRNLRVQRSDG